MRHINLFTVVLVSFVMLASVSIICGCDTGEQVVDEVTGNRAVKQYHQSEEKLNDISEQQAEKYDDMMNQVDQLEQ